MVSYAFQHTHIWTARRSDTFSPVPRLLSLSSLFSFFPRFSSTAPAKILSLIQTTVLSFVEFRRSCNSENFAFANGLSVVKRRWHCLTIDVSLRLILSSGPATLTRNLGPPFERKGGSNETTNYGDKLTRNQATKNRKHLVSVAYLKVRSVASRENFHLLKGMVINNRYDIFTISESWQDSTICDADIFIPGYTTFRQDRGLHKRGGGLLAYAKNIYEASVIEEWSLVSEFNFQKLWLKVQCKKFTSFLLCTVYRPPDAPINFLEGLSETFVDSLLHGLNVLILGDLNSNVL